MIGAILGDMIGAPYEFDRGGKTKEFPLFGPDSQFTDDTVMTVAVAQALMDAAGKSDDEIRAALTASMRDWGRRYPHAGYGGMFGQWLRMKDPKPYGSFGNGAAMRASAAGWLYDTLEKTLHAARLTAEVTHDHPEGIKGAEAAAGAVFLARTGAGKDSIRAFITEYIGYDLSRTCDEIRPDYHHVESCQQTVPEAVTAFLEGEDFEDVIRTAVSLGGDCDTLTCIAGGIAEAFFGVPDELAEECRKRLPADMLAVIDRFEQRRIPSRGPASDGPEAGFLRGNERIREAVIAYDDQGGEEALAAVLDVIGRRMREDGHFIIPVQMDEDGKGGFAFRLIRDGEGRIWLPVFTAWEELEKGEKTQALSFFIDGMLEKCLQTDAAGLIIDPFGQPFRLSRELIGRVLKAQGEEEYRVPDVEITPELLEDGSFLRRAAAICGRNPTPLNLAKLGRILSKSGVWVPCTAITGERDEETLNRMVEEALKQGDLRSMVGKTFVTRDVTRMVPDILEKDGRFYFPVFSSAEEMGEYGNAFSKVWHPFRETVRLARSNKKKISGIVIDAFSAPFIVPMDMAEAIAALAGSEEKKEDKDNE